MLLTMSIGLNPNLLSNERLQEHVKNGQVSKLSINFSGKVEYNKEVFRRSVLLFDGSDKIRRPV